MASQAQIFEVIEKATGPVNRKAIAEALGEKTSQFQTVLNRMEGKKYIKQDGEFNYEITDEGREEMLKISEFGAAGGDMGLTRSDEKLGTTEYQQFIKLGRITGITPFGLIVQTADHIWNGGKYDDLNWVAQGMKQMGVRQDLLNRWFHSWRTYLHMALPENLPPEVANTDTAKAVSGTASKAETGKDYILSDDDVPVKVGAGLGDMAYQDAMDLAKIRASRRITSAAAQASGPGAMAEEIKSVLGVVREVMGDNAKGKSFIVKPTEEGYAVEEYDPGKPLVLPQRQAQQAQAPGFLVKADGSIQTLEPGKPVVIIKDTPPPSVAGGHHYMVDRATGKVEEIAGGQPIVIFRDTPPQQVAQSTPIQVTDKDGKPLVMDISTFIRFEEHKEKKRQSEEKHEVIVEIANSFKDMIKKATNALGNMSGEDE